MERRVNKRHNRKDKSEDTHVKWVSWSNSCFLLSAFVIVFSTQSILGTTAASCLTWVPFLLMLVLSHNLWLTKICHFRTTQVMSAYNLFKLQLHYTLWTSNMERLLVCYIIHQWITMSIYEQIYKMRFEKQTFYRSKMRLTELFVGIIIDANSLHWFALLGN